MLQDHVKLEVKSLFCFRGFRVDRVHVSFESFLGFGSISLRFSDFRSDYIDLCLKLYLGLLHVVDLFSDLRGLGCVFIIHDFDHVLVLILVLIVDLVVLGMCHHDVVELSFGLFLALEKFIETISDDSAFVV